MPSIKTQDLYRVVITESAGIAASGDVDFTVSAAPARTNGFLVLSPENATSREVVYFHNVIGNRIYVRWVNRRSPKLHPANDSVQMNDVEDIFNYYSDMVSPLFYMEKTGTLNVRVWGGTVLVNRAQITIADTNLTLIDNATNYIVYDYLTNIVSVNTTWVGLVKVTVTVTSGIIGTPTYNVIKESYADPLIPDLTLVAPEVQKQTWVYAAATGAVNTFAITLTPAPTAYAAGQRFVFKANLANTGTATLNVNGLGAKTIKKLGGTAILASGDIAINQMVEVEYDGTDFEMQSPIANAPTLTNFTQSFTAWETIAAWNAVYMNTDWLVYLAWTTTTFLWFAKSTVTTGQSVVVDINGISTTQTSLSVGSRYYLTTSENIWNRWDTNLAMTTARYGAWSGLVNNRIYIIWGTVNGSSSMATNEEYNPFLNTWASKTAMTTARFNLWSAVYNNKIYCIGWTANGTTALATNEEYDPVANTWASKTSMTTARWSFGPSIVNNKIYCVGWYNGTTALATNEEYDPVANTWASKANMTTARYGLVTQTYNNKIYCIGWYNGSPIATNEEYDPVANTWASKTAMTTARSGLVAQTYNNKIYCVGWYNGSYLATNEEYDPVANTWASKTSMWTVRQGAWSTQSGWFIYVFGWTTTWPTQVVTSEAYDVVWNTWSNKASMVNPRNFFWSWLVNWKAYIIWWYNGINWLWFNEEYTLPTTLNSWTITTTPNSTKVWVATSSTSLLIQTNF